MANAVKDLSDTIGLRVRKKSSANRQVKAKDSKNSICFARAKPFLSVSKAASTNFGTMEWGLNVI